MSRLATLLIIALGAANLYLALRQYGQRPVHAAPLTHTVTINTPTSGVKGVAGDYTWDDFNRIFREQVAKHNRAVNTPTIKRVGDSLYLDGHCIGQRRRV